MAIHLLAEAVARAKSNLDSGKPVSKAVVREIKKLSREVEQLNEQIRQPELWK